VSLRQCHPDAAKRTTATAGVIRLLDARLRWPGIGYLAGSMGVWPARFFNERSLTILVLSRFSGQKIIVGENSEIIIEVLEVRNGKCRLGITADKNVPIHRQEAREKYQKQEEDRED
jgi:carbon storage regulator CsrA